MSDDEIKVIGNALLNAFVCLDGADIEGKDGRTIYKALQIIKEEMQRRGLRTDHIALYIL